MQARILSVLLSLLPAALAAQTGGIAGYLIARESGEPLAYGIVGIVGLEGLDHSSFTSDSGRFVIRDLSAGPHVLRVRRLGFSPRDIGIIVRANAIDTIRVALFRVAVTLGAVDVTAYPPCVKPGAPTVEEDSTLAAIVGQIRLNAEQYKFLADQYPYWYLSVVTRSSRLRRDSTIRQEPGAIDRYPSSSHSEYKPGGVIQRRNKLYYFQVPTLVEVADKAFVDVHCWHYGGTETFEDEELLRVDVVAFDSLKGPDVNGSFLVSSATFQIRRSVVHLSRRPKQIPDLLDMEVTTEFFEVLPSIPIVSHVYSVQTIDPKRKSLISEAFEEHKTTNLTWLDRKPGDDKKPR